MKFEFEGTNEGVQTIKINGFYLHSRYKPLEEAKRLAKSYYKSGHINILLGYGMGYIVEEMVKLIQNDEKIIVIDPFIRKDDVILRNSNIEVIFKEDLSKVEEVLRNNIDIYSNVNFVVSNNYEKIKLETTKGIIDRIKERVAISKILRNTVNTYASEWQRNYIFNTKFLVDDSSLVNLKKKYNYPIVIASAGPSLTKQIPLLKSYGNNFILLASGSTITTLKHHEIEPDFIISIDGNHVNYLHFKDTIFKKSKLIYSLFNYFKVRESFEKNGFYFVTTNEVEDLKYINKLTNEIPVALAGGASVATFALSVALYISSGPIALIGQDLAYTNNKTHAEHNKQFKEITEQDIQAKKLIISNGYYGNDVYTDYVFLSMKENFESIASKVEKERGLYNCTEGGLNIQNFKNTPFIEFLQQNCLQEIVLIEDKVEKNIDNNYLIKHFENELELYGELINLLKESINLVSNTKFRKYFSKHELEKLEKNDEKFKEYNQSVIMSNILEPITISVFRNYLEKPNETKEQRFERIYNQNMDIYENLLESVKITKDYVLVLLKKLNDSEGNKSE